uniref:Uncharacterized protein n=1 Tax=Arundo donax TaxID=35708 RepID=A0A0A9G8X5_ARUDO
MPPVLLFPVRFIGFWKFTQDLHIIQEDKLPSIQVCSNSDIHILNGCPLEPAS